MQTLLSICKDSRSSWSGAHGLKRKPKPKKGCRMAAQTTQDDKKPSGELDDIKARLVKRVEELRPLVDECLKLEAALRALDPTAVPAPATNATGAPKRRGRPPGTGSRQQAAQQASLV